MENKYPAEAYSWSIISDECAYKTMDKSTFLWRGTGLPAEIKSFFKADNLKRPEKKELDLFVEGDKYSVRIEMDTYTTPRARLFWNADLDNVIKKKFPKSYEQYKADKAVPKTTRMRFTRIDQEKDRYLLEFLGLDYDGDEKKTSYAVIAENDESLWEDVKGEIYHFPNKYKNILKTGVKVIYYKGAIQKKKYSQQRLSDAPHYFGYAEIGEIAADLNSKKGDLFCGVENFVEFKRAIPIKNDNKYLEVIPESQKSNYWRDGVRKINKEVYENILSYADKKITSSKTIQLPPITGEFESYFKEGKKKERFTTYYERNSINRKRAIEIHGYDCKVCGMNFSSQYGKQGDKYIHVHHIRPISSVEGEVKINPKTDLTVLCANCHAMVHRYKDQTLSIEELKGLLVGTLKVRD